MNEKKKILYSMTRLLIVLGIFLSGSCSRQAESLREKINFNRGWKFELDDSSDYSLPVYNDTKWRELDLPHDWSVERKFEDHYPALTRESPPPGTVGWYRKSFRLPAVDSLRRIYITFDGVYRNSEVFVNGRLLGRRANGYISFQYDMTPFLNFGDARNLIAVRVDNSLQPDSRWYNGSGIYRNVWLEKTHPIHIDPWSTHVTTRSVSVNSAEVEISIVVTNTSGRDEKLEVVTRLKDERNKVIARQLDDLEVDLQNSRELTQRLTVNSPKLWSVEEPYLYKAVSTIRLKKKKIDVYETNFGIRYFEPEARLPELRLRAGRRPVDDIP